MVKSVEMNCWMLEEKNVILSIGKNGGEGSNRWRRPESVGKTCQILEKTSGQICRIKKVKGNSGW